MRRQLGEPSLNLIHKFRDILVPLVLLPAFVISCIGGISYMASTRDENLHLERGIMLLKTGDYRLNRHHPPWQMF